MDSIVEVVVGVAIVIGVIGVVVPVLPGVLLVWAAIAVWATERQDSVGWIALGASTAFLTVGQVAKYVLPGRQLGRAGIPGRTTVAGVVLGLVGFVVLPVIGLPLGFVLGIYLAERARLRTHAMAWPSTRQALRAAGWSILIELATALLMAAAWLVGVLS